MDLYAWRGDEYAGQLGQHILLISAEACRKDGFHASEAAMMLDGQQAADESAVASVYDDELKHGKDAMARHKSFHQRRLTA